MQYMEISSWAEFKTLVLNKALSVQYANTSNAYEIYAIEANVFMWHTSIIKNDGADHQDFESRKSGYNKPLEVKAGVGRPLRVAPSPQPINTIQKFKGFSLEIPANETSAYIDIQWTSKDIYLKGGIIKVRGNMGDTDVIKMDVLYGLNDMLIVPNILENIPLHSGESLSFSSPESMALAKELKLRLTVTCEAANEDRFVYVIAEYFE